MIYEYDAFISYRRLDASALAQWIRQRLQRYKLPREVFEKLTPDKKTLHERRPKIWFDKAFEKPSDDFLTKKIYPALDQSARLIVISTPSVFKELQGRTGEDAKNWLVREIDYYVGKETIDNLSRPIDLILGPGGNENLFPSRLSEKERWDWIDFRKFNWWGKFGLSEEQDIGFTKVVAGIYDVPENLLPLLQREERRQRNKLLMGISAVAVAVTLVIVVLGGIAWQQRDEAIKQKGNAESQAKIAKAERDTAEAERERADSQKVIAENKTKEANEQRDSATLQKDIAERQLLNNYWENGRQARADGNALLGLYFMAIAIRDSKDKTFTDAVLQDAENMIPQWKLTNIFLKNNSSTTNHKAGFFKDDTKILSWDLMSTPQVWDIHTGLQINKSAFSSDRILDVGFSRDYSRMLTESRDTVYVLDIETGKQILPSLTHKCQLEKAQFTNDETKILTQCYDRTAFLWDAITGKQICSYSKFDSDMMSTIFSNNGTKCLTWNSDLYSYDSTVMLWDLILGKRIGTSLKHEDKVKGAAFFNNSGNILTWTNKIVRLWNTMSEIPSMKLEPDKNSIICGACISDDGTKFLTWNFDNEARLWDAATGAQIGLSLIHEAYIKGAIFSKDGSKVLTWSDDKTARIWDATTGRQIISSLKHEYKVRGATFSKDETIILTYGDDNTIRLWNVKTGQQIGSSLMQEDNVQGAVFSKNELKLLTWSQNTVRLWNAPINPKVELNLTQDSKVRGAVISKDKSILLTVDFYNSARLWCIAKNKQIGHDFQIGQNKTRGDIFWDAAFTGDNSKLLSWYDSTANLWIVSTGKKIQTFQHSASISGAKFSLDETKILTWGKDSTARVWDIATGKQIIPNLTHNHWVKDAQFSKDEKMILTCSYDGTFRLWNAATGKQEFSIDSGWVEGARYSNDGTRIITWSGDKTVRLWNSKTGIQIGPSIVMDDLINDAIFSKIETKILVTSGRTVKLWDLATRSQIGLSILEDDDINDAVFSKDETIILVRSGRTVKLWELATGRQLGQTMMHGDYVDEAVFSMDEKRILTCCNDKSIRLWDAATGKQIGQPYCHDNAVRNAIFIEDEMRILSWGDDGTARLWDVPGDLDFPHNKFVLQVEALTGTRFNPNTRIITTIPLDEFNKIQSEYIDLAHEHAKHCKYKHQNVYLRFFPDN
jgi:WD40 repeat protein